MKDRDTNWKLELGSSCQCRWTNRHEKKWLNQVGWSLWCSSSSCIRKHRRVRDAIRLNERKDQSKLLLCRMRRVRILYFRVPPFTPVNMISLLKTDSASTHSSFLTVAGRIYFSCPKRRNFFPFTPVDWKLIYIWDKYIGSPRTYHENIIET